MGARSSAAFAAKDKLEDVVGADAGGAEGAARAVKRPVRKAIGAVILLLAIWSFGIEPASLTVRRETLQIPNWRGAPLTIAIASDLHVGSPWCGVRKLRRVVEELNGAHADVVVLLGDYVIQGVAGGRFVAPDRIAQELRNLHGPVYAVLGNHDGWYDARAVDAALKNAGMVVLNDESVDLGRFAFAGVTDLWTGRHDIPRALASVRPDAPVILLTHNPDVFPQVPARVALTLAGHTHGGQVNLPLFGRLIVPSRYGSRYAAGHIVESGRHLFVTTGVGTSIIPVRFRVPPEIVILTVTSTDRGSG
jgi:predicted MPP superfamily phosphohydrolase